MSIVNICGISFHYTGEMIFDDVSLAFEKNDRVGLIGQNGSGKTTLLNMIAGGLSPVSGTIIITKGLSIGYLKQDQPISEDTTVYLAAFEAFSEITSIEQQIEKISSLISAEADPEKLASLIRRQAYLNDRFVELDGVTCESRVKAVLSGLGFTADQLSLRTQYLSGGQKTRLALAKLLLQKPDMLLLDEPTNHLDFDSLVWLESCLSGYPGFVLIVSHDRYFLDKVATRIAEIEDRKICLYKGNYSASRELRRFMLDSDKNRYERTNAEIRHLKEVITKLRRFNREKSVRRARSFEKKLERMEQPDTPKTEKRAVRIDFSDEIAASKDVLQICGLSKKYGDNVLFDNMSLSLHRGDKLSIIGPNGSGKSTLLKIITGGIKADSGSCRTGKNISTGYYDQEQTFHDADKTIFYEIYDNFPHLSRNQVHNSLAGMLFTGKDHEKKIKHLSGGEKGRLALLKLILSSPDFLILDEPTNHLDIASRERLEAALEGFKGTLMAVSHDRYFINRISAQLLHLKNGEHKYYRYGYKEFEDAMKTEKESLSAVSSSDSASRTSYMDQKRKQSDVRRLESDIIRLNTHINDLDARLDEIEEGILTANENFDYESLTSLTAEKEETEAVYIDTMEKKHRHEMKLKETMSR